MLKSQALTVGLCVGLTLGTVFVPVLDNAWCAWSGARDQDQTHVSLLNPLISSARELPKFAAPASASVKVAGASQKTDTGVPAPWRRPRYMSTELGVKKKLIVGILVDSVDLEISAANVMSNSNDLVPLYSLLNATLQRHANKLVFFVDITQKPNKPPENVIFLNVDKSNGATGPLATEALAYFARVFGNDYDFYFLARYDYYINGGLLIDVVSNISVSEFVFWTPSHSSESGSDSSSSRGNGNSATPCQARKRGGFLISRTALSSISEHCNGNLPGSYVTAAVDHLAESHGTVGPLRTSSTRPENESEWESSFLIGPLRNASEFRRIHEFVCKKRKERISAEMRALQRKIHTIHLRTHYNSDKGLSWPIGFPAPSKPKTRHDVLQWVYFTPGSIFHASEHDVNKCLSGVDRLDVEDIVMNAINAKELKISSSTAKGKMNLTLLHTYRRFDPGRGMEYILDFLNEESGLTSRIEGIRPFLGHIELVPVPFVAETGRVTLLVPITDASASLNLIRSFLTRWIRDPINTDSKMSTVILFVFTTRKGISEAGVGRPGIESAKRLINKFNNQISTTTSLSALSKIGYVVIHASEPDGTRLAALISMLDHLIKKTILKPESLVTILEETHTDFGDDFLNRVRMNTIRGVQVYSPVPFVEYVPELTDLHQLSKNHQHRSSSSSDTAAPELEIHKTKGYFQHDDYGFLSFYIADFLAARESVAQFLAPSGEVQNWTSLVEIFLLPRAGKNMIHVLRAPEPNLKIRFEYGWLNESICSGHFDQCSKRSWASKEQLAKLIFSSE